MDRHNQTHNDIKPQNFLVKFKNGPNDLTQLEIVLTDFGMAASDSKGGTPIFASPECFEKKSKKSDIFSLGRVILFLLVSKYQFANWLFLPINNDIRASTLQKYIFASRYNSLSLVSQMTALTGRICLQSARNHFNILRRNLQIKINNSLFAAIESVIINEISNEIDIYTLSSHHEIYMLELSDFRLFQI